MRTDCSRIMESLFGVMKMFCSYMDSWWLYSIVNVLSEVSSTYKIGNFMLRESLPHKENATREGLEESERVSPFFLLF